MAGVLLLFPGQGSQSVGMGRHLWETYPVAREVFHEAEDLLGWDLRGLCMEGPMSELTRTDVAQPAIFVCSVAAWRVLHDFGLTFDVAVGHSLGEYSALVSTGQIPFAEALRVVQHRGHAMWECGRHEPGTMAAIIGLGDDEVDALCAEVGQVWTANYNCPGQVVISGSPDAVEAASEVALLRGARRALPLAVTGAFHSPLVSGAEGELRGVLEGVTFGPPAGGRFFSTTELRYPEPEHLKETLVRQLTSPVRFTQSMRALTSEMASAVEVGPGGVLSGLVKRVASGLTVFGTDGAAQLGEVRARVVREVPRG